MKTLSLFLLFNLTLLSGCGTTSGSNQNSANADTLKFFGAVLEGIASANSYTPTYSNYNSYGSSNTSSPVIGSSGNTYSKYGNTVYGSDGTSYSKYGNTTYGSDGTSYSTYGNTTYGSDGTNYSTYGNTTYGSDGTSCSTYGNTAYCN